MDDRTKVDGETGLCTWTTILDTSGEEWPVLNSFAGLPAASLDYDTNAVYFIFDRDGGRIVLYKGSAPFGAEATEEKTVVKNITIWDRASILSTLADFGIDGHIDYDEDSAQVFPASMEISDILKW